MNRISSRTPRRRMDGLTLIELMIALVLGLLVVGVAIGIFASNRQTYRATENLGWMQENVRVAFELMARDLREAGGNPCVNSLPIANVLNPPTSGGWWANLQHWGTAVRGYAGNQAFPGDSFGTGTAARRSGTEAIELMSGDDTVATIRAHNTGSNQFTVNTTTHGFGAGDVLLACNSRQAAIFQASAVSGANIAHNSGGGPPGNCTASLGLVGVGEACSTREPFEFAAPNSVITRLHATRWFIANNPSGRSALYQSRVGSGAVVSDEVAEGVTNMQITYLRQGAATYETAVDVNGRWDEVIAARIQLTVESVENTGVGGVPITRELVHVASLRNRNT